MGCHLRSSNIKEIDNKVLGADLERGAGVVEGAERMTR